MNKAVNKAKSSAASLPADRSASDALLHRSGAVAQMLGMPVATLRVWERRYALTQPSLTVSGQRLYSDDDVQRLAVIKQLTAQGHAIGRLAKLDMAQLQRVAATHAQAQALAGPAGEPPTAPGPARPWRLVVIGAALATRLQQPALLRRLARPLSLLGPFEDLAQAAAALQDAPADGLLIHAPRLHADWLAEITAAAPGLAGLPRAALYRFAADPVCDTLANAGIALLREPQPDAVLAQWLNGLSASAAAQPATDLAGAPGESALPPRRWDDAALADFASRSTTTACECPRHVAELLMQLAHFEAYSAECAHRHAADAELHADLHRLAAGSRSQFEAALAQVALHEGVMLPPPRAPAHRPSRRTPAD